MLLETVECLVHQTLPIEAVVVVDNADDAALQSVLTSRFPTVTYVGATENLGFGAGLAAGMRHAVQMDTPPTWFWLLDDDSPTDRQALKTALDVTRSVPGVAVVGTRGGHIRGGRIKHDLHDVRDMPGTADFTLVDGALVSATAVSAVGYPREDLFMMLEDVEYTTRITDAGFTAMVRPRDGSVFHHMGSQADWRAYYQSRNHLRIAIDRRSPSWLWGWLYRECAISLASLRRRRWRVIRFRLRGALDAVRGRMGRTVEPG